MVENGTVSPTALQSSGGSPTDASPAIDNSTLEHHHNESSVSEISSSADSATDVHKVENRFFLGCCLVKSPHDSDIVNGLALLEDILSTKADWNHKEVLFNICLGHYRKRDTVQAKILCQKLLASFSNHKDGRNLMKVLQYEVKEMRKSRVVRTLHHHQSGTMPTSPLSSSSMVLDESPTKTGNTSNSVFNDETLAAENATTGVIDVDNIVCPPEYKPILKLFSEDELNNLVECFRSLTQGDSMLDVFDMEQFGEGLSVLQFTDFTYSFIFEYFRKCFSSHMVKAMNLTEISPTNSSEDEKSTTINFAQFLCTMGILLKAPIKLQLTLSFAVLDGRDEKGYLTEADIRHQVEMMLSILQFLSLETIPVDRVTKHIVKELKNDNNLYRISRDEEIRIHLEDFIGNGEKNYDRIIGLGILLKPLSGFTLENTLARRGLHSVCGSKNFTDIFNIMLGIRLAQDMFRPLTRSIQPIDFSTCANFSLSHAKKAHTFTDYAPRVFKKIRSFFQISDAEFLFSLAPETFLGRLFLGSWRALSETESDGRSGACFFYTDDGKYVIKNIPSAESAALKRVLPIYYQHLRSYKSSFLVKYLSLFDYDRRSFCIMTNAFQTQREIHEIYDLKGSVVARSNPNGRVMKDMDLKQVLDIGKERRDRLLHVLWSDIDTLLDLKFTDYSLLLGIHSVHGQPRHNSVSTQSPPEVQANNDPHIPKAPPLPDSLTRGRLTLTEQRDILERERLVVHNGGMKFDLSDMMEPDGGIRSRDGHQIYYLCIIDTLTEYTWTKSAERSLKTFKYGAKRRNEISAQPPDVYAMRLKAFIAKILK